MIFFPVSFDKFCNIWNVSYLWWVRDCWISWCTHTHTHTNINTGELPNAIPLTNNVWVWVNFSSRMRTKSLYRLRAMHWIRLRRFNSILIYFLILSLSFFVLFFLGKKNVDIRVMWRCYSFRSFPATYNFWLVGNKCFSLSTVSFCFLFFLL